MTKRPKASFPTSSPTAPKTIDEVVDKLLPDGANDLVDPIAKWYYSDMHPTGLSGATAGFVNLATEVSDDERNIALYDDAITSALRLYTRGVYKDKAEVGIKFYDGAANLGLFNGMKFKDMVADGITFEYSFFKAYVGYYCGYSAAAPEVKVAVYSPRTSMFTTFVWEPRLGGLVSGDPAIDTWITNVVNTTTGTSRIDNDSSGWRQTEWPPSEEAVGNLAAWADYFDTHDWRPTTNPMEDAIVTAVSIGVGPYIWGITSYVDSLRIVVDGYYDWKWTFHTEIFE